MTKRYWAAAALALSTTVTGALAQEELVGRWQCQQANRTVSNNAFENWIYEFALALNSNGRFQAQGNYTAQTNGFSIPFIAEGGWSVQQGGVVVQGRQQQQGMGQGDFVLVFTNVGQREMSNQYDSANGRLLTYCQR